jgi:phage recombination protein Bet
MTIALATTTPPPPAVTADQLELVRRTIAAGATPDELKLYLYDCARQGVHPLDGLLHFTKRGGKYRPVTSIDFMRTRAAETGEYAGSDDAQFVRSGPTQAALPAAFVRSGPTQAALPAAATVTVWRLVQGQRCAFTATARWAEYCPPAGQDHMWQKMPHTMLAKCAEGLALRKGFPRQLAGLYAAEELDQAEPSPPPVVPDYPTGRPLITEGQRRKLFATAADMGWSRDQLKDWLAGRGIDSTTKIAQADLNSIIEAIESHAAPQPDRDLRQE